MSEAHGPLQGVKVVSCSTAQAGTVPYMLMADLGADVIKIEAPDSGDNSRVASVLPGMPSTFFETNNRGVKSVTLNLKLPEARAILHKLVADADIFGQNFRPGAAEKNGFGWEDLRKVNPRLVYMSISGYGPNGPNARSSRHRLDGAGAGRHRAGLCDAGSAVEDRRRLRRRRDLRDPRLRRRAGGAHPCAQHRRRPEGRLLAARRPDPADGLDADDGDVAQPRPGHGPGAHRRHPRKACDVRKLQRQGRQAVRHAARARPVEGGAGRAGLLRGHGPGRLRPARRGHGIGRGARGAAEETRRIVRDRHARRMGGAAARGRYRLGADQHHARGRPAIRT